MLNKLSCLLISIGIAFVAYPLALAEMGAVSSVFDAAQFEAEATMTAIVYVFTATIGGAAFFMRFATFRGTKFWKWIVIWTAASVGVWVVFTYLFSGDAPKPVSLTLFVAINQIMLSSAFLIIRRRWLRYAGAFFIALIIVLLALGEQLLQFDPSELHTGTAGDIFDSFRYILANGRGIVVLFVVSAAVSFQRFRRRLSGQGHWLRSYGCVLWVVATHMIWFGGALILDILSDMPRWFLLVTPTLMLGLGAGIPLFIARFSNQLTIRTLIYNPNLEGEKNAWAEFHRGTIKSARRAWIISYTGVSNEPRVLRQSKALLDAGWEVTVCGFDGHSERPDEWNFVRIPSTDPFRPWFRTFLSSLNSFANNATVYGRPRFLFKWAHHLVQETNPTWLQIRLEIMRIASENTDVRPDLVIAHDYYTSDIGFRLARRFDAKFSVDVHEYAVMQYTNDPQWVKYSQPVIRTVQDHYLRRADLVTVLGQSIGDLLKDDIDLKREPVVIRNVPFRSSQPYRPASGDKIQVLYHGDLSRPREIMMAVQSVPMWDDRFELVLRGGGDLTYIGELKRTAARLGVEDRVKFVDPVSFSQIISAANKSDIGFFAYRAYSPQIQFALPNKFFEYVMAGLAICVSDLQEVGGLVKKFGNGRLIPSHTPQSIAETINGFTEESINECKKASLEAAKELNWEVESVRLIQAYDSMWGESDMTSKSRRRQDSGQASAMSKAQKGVSR